MGSRDADNTPPADECPDCSWDDLSEKPHPRDCPSCGGTGDRPEHLYEGDCPVEGMWDARDPHCPACRAMGDRPAVTDAEVEAACNAQMDAWHEGLRPADAMRAALEAAAKVRP